MNYPASRTNATIRKIISDLVDPMAPGEQITIETLTDRVQKRIPRAAINNRRVAAVLRERDDMKRVGTWGRATAAYGSVTVLWQKVEA